MAHFQNLMEILKLLPQTNCRQCDEKTCMAFAASVFKGEKSLSLCPYVDPQILQKYGANAKRIKDPDEEIEKVMQELKQELRSVDFSAAASRTGGRFDGRKLTLSILGKEFSVDPQGTLKTDIHTNPWVTIPILNYILNCKGAPVSGKWMSLRELPGGNDWQHFFNHQVEKPLKKLADTYPDLFEDLVHLFDGKPADHYYQSDVSIILRPLPLVPLLICYWRPEDGMDSSLNLFFDATADDNLGVQGLYALGAGITRMFQKLAQRHGVHPN